ncbi:MAG: Crp/Fnr family transcriptional regulator [Pseudomonadota bacterium]
MQKNNITQAERSFLATTDWLSHFASPVIKAILDASIARDYAAGATIYKKNAKPDGIFGVISGEIRFSEINEAGQLFIMGICRPGEWTGDISSLDGGGRMSDAHAAVGTRVAYIKPVDIETIAERFPTFRRSLVTLFCANARSVFEQFSQLLMLSPERFLAWRLYHLYGKSPVTEDILLRQEDLAGLAGVSRQSIYLILKNWKSQEIAESRYGKIRIIDLNRLEKIFLSGD